MKKFRVYGMGVNDEVYANSKKQAKLKAGFRAGFGGPSLSKFFRSRNVKIEQTG